MKQVIVILMSVLLLAVIGCQSGNAGEGSGDVEVTLDTEKNKASYAIGFNMGQQVRNIKDHVDINAILMGLKDGIAGDDSAKMTPDEIREIMTAFQKRVSAIMGEQRKAQGAKNKVDGEKFLAENAKKEGVITTKSGLQYVVIKEGTGATPKATDKITAHYEGTFLDGKMFQSSYKMNRPFTFALNSVVPGWIEGIQLMKVGGKYKFFIPYNLAYGEQGNRGIPPFSTLIFVIELVSIEDGSKPAPKPAEKKK